MNTNEAHEDNVITEWEWVIMWDAGDYAGFDSEGEAKAFQRAHRMAGSTVEYVPVS